MVRFLTFALTGLLLIQQGRPSAKTSFTVVEASIQDMQTAMAEGRVTPRAIAPTARKTYDCRRLRGWMQR
jgi:hypothetical protein